MFTGGFDRRRLAGLAVALLLLTAGCLGSDARGGEVVGTYAAAPPPDVDAADRDDVSATAIGRVVDEACAAGAADDAVVVTFDPSERRPIRDEYDRLGPDDGDLFVRCARADGVVRVRLRLYS